MRTVNKMGCFQIVKEHHPSLRRHRYVIVCHGSRYAYENCPVFTSVVFYGTKPLPVL